MSEGKSRAAHNWRNLAWEVGIVVGGVLIALGAQQIVESWSWRHKVAAAEESMQEEIKNSLLAGAELKRLDKCVTAQIDGLQRALVDGDTAAAARIAASPTMYGAGRLWADNAFSSTLSAQVVDHLGAEKLKYYSQVYTMIRFGRQEQDAMESAADDLGTLRILGLPRSSGMTDLHFRAVARLRANREASLSIADLIAQFAAKDLGLRVSENDYLAARGRRDVIRECEAAAAAVKS